MLHAAEEAQFFYFFFLSESLTFKTSLRHLYLLQKSHLMLALGLFSELAAGLKKMFSTKILEHGSSKKKTKSS